MQDYFVKPSEALSLHVIVYDHVEFGPIAAYCPEIEQNYWVIRTQGPNGFCHAGIDDDKHPYWQEVGFYMIQDH